MAARKVRFGRTEGRRRLGHFVDIFSRPLDSIGRQLTRLGMRAKLDSFFLSMETSWAGSPLTPRPHLDNST